MAAAVVMPEVALPDSGMRCTTTCACVPPPESGTGCDSRFGAPTSVSIQSRREKSPCSRIGPRNCPGRERREPRFAARVRCPLCGIEVRGEGARELGLRRWPGGPRSRCGDGEGHLSRAVCRWPVCSCISSRSFNQTQARNLARNARWAMDARRQRRDAGKED